ncbi:DUF459 domain-containing protein [Mesorhizobium sp. ZMM04-5]|uniref:DUF459 domain-containing protein n=1 Tax=Mesorhizobium marinum TaxID=3228790 RepID=A0ABV3QU88_9HYPH
MAAGTGNEVRSSRFAALVLALAAVTAAFAILAPSASHAQERERIGILNRLFGARDAERVEPRAEMVKPKVRKKTAARRPAEGEEPPQVTVISKHSDARVVLVIGDFLASGLAEGLTTAVIQNPNIRIVDRSNGSSGFVRKDFYDWAARIDDLIKADRPSAIVVMIGANDRQQMLVDGVRETVRSEAWNREYADRAQRLAKAITARNVPLLWVGMPPFKSSKTMLDMFAFNDVYRTAATGAGGEFIDIWDGFVDENGAYVSSGPDLNGQPSRLRANDGINLARPGKRKVAFYAEKPLYRVLGEDPAAAAAQVSALAARPAYRIFGPFGPSEQQEPADIDVLVDPNETGLVDPARPVALRTPALDGGAELLGAIAEPRREAVNAAEKLAIEGLAPKPPAGRADQFAWPQLASAAAVTRYVNIDTTLNRRTAPSQPEEAAVDRAAVRAVRSNVLTEPEPPVPPRMPPEVQPDRIGEISPVQAAPDVAAAEPPMTSPATIDKAHAPDYAKGDPLDRSPSRGAPLESFKRPKSIGPEPNRAPTAVPEPVEEIVAPVDDVVPALPGDAIGPEESEPVADATPAQPDTAPARPHVPLAEPGIVDALAPARAAPLKAVPTPVASLPATKEAPSEIRPAPVAPVALAPADPVEPTDGFAAARAVGMTPDVASAPPARSAPLSEAPDTAPAPLRAAPGELPAPVADTPIASAPAAAPRPVADPSQIPAPVSAKAPPAAPAPPSVLPEPPEEKAASPDAGETEAGPAMPAGTAEPATPIAPAPPPTVLPQPAPAPADAAPRRRAELSVEPDVTGFGNVPVKIP